MIVLANSNKKKISNPFDYFFNDFDIEQEFERDMANLQSRIKDLMSEAMDCANNPKKSQKSQAPFVYGFSMRIDSGGKPLINEFGSLPIKTQGETWENNSRQPLVDLIVREKEIAIIVEIPGVDKSDISLKANPDNVRIDVDTPSRKYHKLINLPKRVLSESAKASYKNGLLEVTLDLEKPNVQQFGKPVKIQ